jgi:NAD(P)-dependent dehydrogenase (short-subunit alcohol dehydrogenase family)
MKVVLGDIEPATLEREVTRLSEAGGDVLGVHCDVRDPAHVAALAEKTLSHYGAVHVVMNNAGVCPIGPMLETTPEDWRWTFDVNVLGVAHGVLAFGPILRDAGEGHIVNTASEAGLLTNPSLGAYCASKHAVVGLSEALYRELEGTGVGVHCLCPNLVRTRIFESERNREDTRALSPTQTAETGALREAIASMGIPTDEVALDVVEAIREHRFWVFTHAVTASARTSRYRDIEAGRNPTDPYAEILGFERPQEGSAGD